MSDPSTGHSAGIGSSSRQEVGLLATLAFLSGLVDVTGWLSFDQLFTSHITGNLVLLSAGLAGPHPSTLARLLALPVFALALAFAYLAVLRAPTGRGHLLLLRAQTVLLTMVWLLMLLLERDARVPGGLLLPGMLAVATIGVQCAFVRVSLHESQGTSVMTSNFITLVLAAVALIRPGPLSRGEARERLRRTLPMVLAFVVACPLAAAAVARLGSTRAWVVPILASLLVFPLAPRGPFEAVEGGSRADVGPP